MLESGNCGKLKKGLTLRSGAPTPIVLLRFALSFGRQDDWCGGGAEKGLTLRRVFPRFPLHYLITCEHF